MTLFGIISLTFVLWGIQYYVTGHTTRKVLARVGSTDITEQQVNRLMHRMGNIPNNRAPKETLMLSRSSVVQMLVNDRALVQSLIDQGYDVDLMRSAQLDSLDFPYGPLGVYSSVKDPILVNQYQEGLSLSAFILPNEVDQLAQKMHQERYIRYRVISPETIHPESVTSASIEAYYHGHPSDFLSPERVRIQYVRLKPEDVIHPTKPADAELRQFYENHSDLVVPPGQDTIPEFEAVHQKIQDAWLHQEHQKQWADAREALSELTYINPQNLQVAAKKLHLTIKKTGLFGREDGESALTQNPKIRQAAWSDDVLTQGNNSEVITLKDGSLVVLRLEDHQSAQRQPLSAVRSQIEKILLREQAISRAQATGDALIKKIQGGLVPDASGWHYDHITPEQKSMHGVFQLKVSEWLGFTRKNGDYVIVQLLNIKNHTPSTPQIQAWRRALSQWEYRLSVAHWAHALGSI